MSKFAKVIQTVKGEEGQAKVRGKSRREDYVGLKVYIPKELHRRLKLKALEMEKEVSELVEEALKALLDRTHG
uniref:CopG family transcriptional regulator n=1 Tax=Thermus caliditerrae TaxID=1330700 RepID=A0A7C5VIU2_9DEIN